MRLPKILFLSLFILVATFAITSCGDGGSVTDPAGGTAPVTVDPSLLGAVRGRVAAGGILPRDVRAQSLPPTGTAVIIDDPELGPISVTTDEQGNFFFPGLTAGEQTLTVPSLGLVQSITVIAGAEVLLQQYPVSRQQAIDQVLTLLNSRAEFSLNEAFIIAPHNPLPAGVALTQALGTLDPGIQTNPAVTTLTRPQWLIYLDAAPSVGFHHHEIEYFLVDAQTGAVETETRTSYPQINGVAYYQESEDYLNSTALVSSPVIPNEPQKARRVVSRQASQPEVRYQATGDTYVLTVDGHNNSSAAADLRKFKQDILPNLKGIPPVKKTVDYNSIKAAQEGFPAGQTPGDGLISTFQALCRETQVGDTLVIYITSHGNKQGIILNGTKSSFKKGTPSVQGDSVLTWGQAFDFKDCKACQVVVITEACHAGSMFFKNVVALSNLNKKGRRFALLASAQRPGPAEGNSVAIPPYILEEETGGLYTTYFSDEILASTETDLFDQLENAHARTKTILDNISFTFRPTTQKRARAMNPLIFVDRAVGETCEDLADPTTTPSPSPSPTTPQDPPCEIDTFQPGDPGTSANDRRFSFNHVPGCDTVPVFLGSFKVSNPDGSLSQVQLSAGSHIRLRTTAAPTPVQDLDFDLAVGAEQVVEVVFIGSTSNSFGSSITAICQDESGSDNTTITITGTMTPALVVSPQMLSDNHLVGVTACPDPVGQVTLTNNCNTAQNFTITPQGLPVFTTPASGSIPANSSISVDVFFDCSTTTSFTRTITVQLPGIPVSGAIQVPATETFQTQVNISM